MYDFIKGKIAFKSPTYVVVENQGVGYHLNISVHTFSKINEAMDVKLFTHLNVKEDDLSLFGFFEEAERTLFRLLISVSGIGPNTGRVILSSLSPSETKSAILHEDVLAFKKVKGVGPKTAQRIILDLKDKVAKTDIEINVKSDSISGNTMGDEALSALLALGFNKKQVTQVFNKIYSANLEIKNVEQLIKISLKELSN